VNTVSKTFDTNTVRGLQAAERFKQRLENKYDKVNTVAVGLDRVRIEGCAMSTPASVLYECGICGSWHEWDFVGDCRQDDARFPSPEEYAEAKGINVNDVEVRSMEDRVQADLDGEE